MKNCITLLALALGLSLSLGVAHAEDGKKPTQQQKMKTCNADAKTKGLKGDARKAFMKDCLSNKADAAPATAAATATTPAAAASAPAAAASSKADKKAMKDKKASCKADAKAKGLKGDDRKKAVADCLAAK